MSIKVSDSVICSTLTLQKVHLAQLSCISIFENDLYISKQLYKIVVGIGKADKTRDSLKHVRRPAGG